MSSSESDDEKKKKKVAKKQVSALQAKKQQQGATKQATREQRNAAARNSSLQVTGKVTNSIVGPINEWKCIPENLPNHPTMVSRLLLLWLFLSSSSAFQQCFCTTSLLLVLSQT